MKYVGSKNRISQQIAPIIQKYIDINNYNYYIEPFVGGANMIDKIVCENKYGFDSHKYLIALLNQMKKDTGVFPKTFDEELYKTVRNNMENSYEDWFIGLVGFCSFGGKWFGGYPRGFKEDGITKRDIVNETIRNMIKQADSENFKNCNFFNKNFQELNPYTFDNCLIYCDPPYKNTTKYSVSDFPYEDFYNWCREIGKNNTVLVSEYDMPDDFKCIWKKPVKTSLDSNRGNKNTNINRTERLFIANR